jgi:hypothetical protein
MHSVHDIKPLALRYVRVDHTAVAAGQSVDPWETGLDVATRTKMAKLTG